MHRLVCCYSSTIRPTSDVLQEALEGTVSYLRMFLQYEPRLEQTLCLRGREAFMIHVFWTGLNTIGVPKEQLAVLRLFFFFFFFFFFSSNFDFSSLSALCALF